MRSNNGFSNTVTVYEQNWKFFERPVWTNTPYKFDALNVASPYDFNVKIKDDISPEFDAQLKSLLENYAEILKQEKVGNIGQFISEHKNIQMYSGMPVILNGVVDGQNHVARAEVLAFIGETIAVELIDEGGVVETALDEIFPVTLSIMRIPKLALACRLAFIRPEGPTWPENIDFLKIFTGDCQIVYFQDFYGSTRAYETILEVDGINIGIKLFHDGVAQPVQLPVLSNELSKSSKTPQYPSFDFTPWLGLKTMVFGLRAFKGEGNQARCILQLQPEELNAVQDIIAAYVATPENLKNVNFDIAPGVCCLARYGGAEYFRAKILKVENNSSVEVDYVDYKEVGTVPVSSLLKLPENLLCYPEGANECLITDFLMEECADFEKLSELVKDKDLYAVLDACDPELFGSALLVSLFRPVDFSGPDESFLQIFDVTMKPTVIRELLQDLVLTSEAQASVFLKPRLPDPTKIYPGAMISVIRSWDSIWIQLEEESNVAARISGELTIFYENLRCSTKEVELFESVMVVGNHVAAQQPGDDEEVVWYRAKILKKESGRLQLLYIDYGNLEWVNQGEVYPLHDYFAKDDRLAFELGFPIRNQ